MSVTLNIAPTESEVLTNLANFFMQVGTQAIIDKGRFSVSLSGGSSPKKLYELLASAEYKDMIDWTKVDFFFGDERNVPQDDKDSNYLMVKTALFDPLNVPHENIYAVNTSSGPDGAAKEYTIAVLNYFEGKDQIFDLVLLGLGDNSHTASLFPYTPVLNDCTASVQEVYLEDQQVFRITMTAPLINLAKHIAFLVYGKGKALAVRHVLEDEKNIPEYPAQLIRNDASVVWFLDEAAASELASK